MSNVHTHDYQQLLQKLRQARLDSGLTQLQVAAKLKKHQSFVAKCESGERRIDFVELQAFARVYQKPIAYFEAAPAKLSRRRA
jgi:transcriptional regulator with XRE-family HTH domain